MKVYFAATPQQKKGFQSIQRRICQHLENLGHKVFTNPLPEDTNQLQNFPDFKINELNQKWNSKLNQSQCAIIEGSFPSSINTGYQLGQLVHQQKPTILLYEEEKKPPIAGMINSSRLVKSAYNDKILEDVLDWCLGEIKNTFNRRFTFYISPEIDHLLNKASQNNSVSKSELIRRLIRKEF